MNDHSRRKPVRLARYIPHPDGAAASRRRPVVLAVDDQVSMTRAIKQVLEAETPVRVIQAETSDAALKLARRHKFDLVISDLARPEMNGWEFLSVFTRTYPGVPVIIASGILTPAGKRRASRLGAWACFVKPFPLTELVEAVDLALAGFNTGGRRRPTRAFAPLS